MTKYRHFLTFLLCTQRKCELTYNFIGVSDPATRMAMRQLYV